MKHKPLRAHLAVSLTCATSALLVAPSCGSSGKGESTTTPPSSPAVPPSYALALSDRDAEPGLEAYVVDLQTGESSRLDVTLPGSGGIRRDSLEVSPGGRYASVTTGGSLDPQLSIIDLATSARRTVTRLSAPGGEGSRGGEPAALVMFSPGDLRVAIQDSPLDRRIRVGTADGSSLTTYGSDSLFVEPVQWLDADRLLLKTLAESADHQRVSILDLRTGAMTPISPTPGDFSDIEEVLVSADGRTVAMMIAYELGSSASFRHVYTANLMDGAERAFELFDASDDAFAIAADGSFVAYEERGGGNDRGVILCDLDSGTSTRINAPITIAAPRLRGLFFSEVGNTLAYIAEHEVVHAETLYVHVPGSGTAVPVPVTLSTNAEIESPRWSPTGSGFACAYRDAVTTDFQPALVDSAHPTPTLEFLDPSMMADIDEDVSWSPDGAWILAEDQDANFEDILVAYPLPAGSGTAPVVLGPAWSRFQRLNLTSAVDTARVAQVEGTSDLLYIGRDVDGTGETVRLVDPDDPATARVITLPAGPQGSEDRILQLYVRTLD